MAGAVFGAVAGAREVNSFHNYPISSLEARTRISLATEATRSLKVLNGVDSLYDKGHEYNLFVNFDNLSKNSE